MSHCFLGAFQFLFSSRFLGRPGQFLAVGLLAAAVTGPLLTAATIICIVCKKAQDTFTSVHQKGIY